MAIERPALPFCLGTAWHNARRRASAELKQELKQLTLALLMGYSSDVQLADNLAGRGHLSVQRVLMLVVDPSGRVFLRYLALEIAEAAGYDLDALLIVTRLERVVGKLIDRVQKRVPVKAELREREERKQA